MEIPINGLIWMNEKDHMIDQARQKLSEGFGCIKMKIGAIKFEEELEVLEYIRKQRGDQTTLRVDANGAFSGDEVIARIERLSAYQIHSIEQPIQAGNWKAMATTCKESAIPVALDEELIGMGKKKEELLLEIRPQYIVLKPTLLGGLSETDEWIGLAEKYKIGWWITSMLESNIGLNAISQFAAEKSPGIVHGLGTGKLYSNNIESPLTIQDGHISYLKSKKWDYSLFPWN
jgi:L-alanine-DL-glutamate epimerase-like enolase superfamily enzyme